MGAVYHDGGSGFIMKVFQVIPIATLRSLQELDRGQVAPKFSKNNMHLFTGLGNLKDGSVGFELS